MQYVVVTLNKRDLPDGIVRGIGPDDNPFSTLPKAKRLKVSLTRRATRLKARGWKYAVAQVSLI